MTTISSARKHLTAKIDMTHVECYEKGSCAPSVKVPTTYRRIAWSLLELAKLCLLLLLCLVATQRVSRHGSEKRYDGETLAWERCGNVGKHPLECATLDVPLDQFDSANSGSRTWSLALMRLRGKTAKHNILLNPGGPGGSGLNFMYRYGEHLSTIVGDDFHLLAFDPRGVNQSFPQALCYSSEEARTIASLTQPKDIDAQAGLYAARSVNLARSCFETMGEYGKYLDTPQTAADMNSILDAVGQKGLYYWGFSYGTTLGQTYAQLFPERSERVIIDGVSSHSGWYNTGRRDLTYQLDVEDTEKVFDGFAAECIKAGDACALAADFEDGKQLRKNLTSMLESLKKEPIAAYVNASTWGELGWPEMAHNAVFAALYKPKLWPELAQALAGILHGNYSQAFLAYAGQEPGQSMSTELNLFVISNDVPMAGRSRRSTEEIVDAVHKLEAISPLSGLTFADDLFLLQEWQYPATHNYTPSTHAQTLHPLLILSTTYDPICPLSSAREAEGIFEGSVLLEQRGYGHCSISMPNLCKAKYVLRYLTHGELPPSGTACDDEGAYFDLQGSDMSSMSEEDQALQRALDALANEIEFS